jgi:outer membrane murein-binding lipoprotein Lpp
MDRDDFSRGLYSRYQITKRDGGAVDKDAHYFVLRIDNHGDDRKHIQACQEAALTYAKCIRDHIPKLASDLEDKIAEYRSKAAFHDTVSRQVKDHQSEIKQLEKDIEKLKREKRELQSQ